MITRTQGTDTFWPVVEKAGNDAANADSAEFEYNFAASGDMADMSRLIEDAAATNPDGLIMSPPDAGALGKGNPQELAGADIRHLMAGGIEMANLKQELAAI